MNQTGWEAVIFDVDGTLFQTEQVAVPAFHRVFERLQKEGRFHGERPDDEKLKSVFGMTIPELWKTLLPDATMDERDIANEWLAENNIGLIREGVGELYPGVEEALQTLYEKGVKLFTASNGEKRYVEAVITERGLAPLFTKLYSAGEYKTEAKEELVAKLLQDQGVQRTVMVGDRRSDVKAGRANRLPVIGCDFGFGGAHELEGADVVITRFDQLLPKLDELAQRAEEPHLS
jgi:phosphoglycolate phosphatase